MPNPSGVNSFDQFRSEESYGAKQRLTNLERGAPIPGNAASALNAPRRAKRHATGQDQPEAPSIPMGQMVDGTGVAEPSYEAQLTSVWGEIASDPNASELVREYAARAGA
jgi:hypothetical protein